MKKILVTFGFLLICSTAYAAEQTKDAFNTTLNTAIGDRQSGTVPASTLKTLFANIKDSVPFSMTRYITMSIPGSLEVGDGTGLGGRCFEVLSDYNLKNLVSLSVNVGTVGTSGSANLFQVRNFTDSVDILTTKLMLDASENKSSTATTAYVIDLTKDDVATGDILCVDIDQLNTTPPQNAIIVLGFK